MDYPYEELYEYASEDQYEEDSYPRQPRHRKILRDNYLRKAGLMRLIRKAGIKRISGLIYEELRGVMKVNLEGIIKNSVIIMEHERKKTISGAHVRKAAQTLGITLPIREFTQVRSAAPCPEHLHPDVDFSERTCRRTQLAHTTEFVETEDGTIQPVKFLPKRPAVTCRYRKGAPRKAHEDYVHPEHKKYRATPGRAALRQIRKTQKRGMCFSLSKANFQIFIREITQDFHTDVRYSAEAMDLLQYYIENTTVDMLSNANLNAIHAKRETVYPKDIQLARHVMGQRH